MVVLVVDDVTDTRETLGALLKGQGHDVLLASSGEAAIALALASRPQAILLDLGLPDIDGYGVIAALRERQALEGTKIIVISGHGSDEAIERSRSAGAHFHLVKPADPELVRILLGGAVTAAR